jgi:hypothetical protein
MKSLFVFVMVLFLASCGQQENDDGSKTIEGRCYVRAALELAYGDQNAAELEFQEIYQNYPKEGSTRDIYDIFEDHAIGDRELTHRNPFTKSDVREYLNSGYMVAIRFCTVTGYHIQCIYNSGDWDLGEPPRLLFVSGDLN